MSNGQDPSRERIEFSDRLLEAQAELAVLDVLLNGAIDGEETEQPVAVYYAAHERAGKARDELRKALALEVRVNGDSAPAPSLPNPEKLMRALYRGASAICSVEDEAPPDKWQEMNAVVAELNELARQLATHFGLNEDVWEEINEEFWRRVKKRKSGARETEGVDS